MSDRTKEIFNYFLGWCLVFLTIGAVVALFGKMTIANVERTEHIYRCQITTGTGALVGGDVDTNE